VSRWLKRLLALAVLVLAGVWGWHVLFPSPEKVIRHRLGELAQTVTILPNTAPAAKLYNAQKLASFFTADVQVRVDVPGQSLHSLHGRQELADAATAAGAMVSSLTVELFGITVVLDPDRQGATTDFTAKANVPGESVPQVQELKAHFKKDGADWLIDRVETVRPLR